LHELLNDKDEAVSGKTATLLKTPAISESGMLDATQVVYCQHVKNGIARVEQVAWA
jgi:hypothetical protein